MLCSHTLLLKIICFRAQYFLCTRRRGLFVFCQAKIIHRKVSYTSYKQIVLMAFVNRGEYVQKGVSGLIKEPRTVQNKP